MYEIWMDILIYGLFLMLISFNYFIFTFINSKFVIKDKVAIIPNVIEGFVNGLIAVLIKTIFLLSFNIEYKYLVLIISILIIVRNFIVYLGAIIPLFIMHWFMHGFGDYSYMVMVSIVTFLLILFTFLKKLFFKNSSLEIAYIPINLLSFFIMLIVSRTELNIDITWSFVSLFFMPLIFLTIIFLVYIFVLSFWKSANSLIDVNIYDFSNFYRIKTSREALGAFLSNNKTKNGIFLLFAFGSKRLNDDGSYRDSVLLNIERQFNKFNALYFKISKDEYGMFFSMINPPNIEESIFGNNLKKRMKNDLLYEIEFTIKELNKYLYRKIKFGATLYGIQEFDFHLAFEKAKFALNSSMITGKNVVSLFDPRYYNKYKWDSLLMKKLNREIYTGHISTEFQCSITSKGNSTNLFYSRPCMPTYSIGVSIKQILMYSEERGDKRVLTRYLAAETIRNFGNAKHIKNKKIMFAYSATLMSTEQFNPKIFVNIVKFHHVSASSIILMLNFSTIENYYKNSQLIKNIEEVRKYGIKISIRDLGLDGKKWVILENISHDYICIDESLYTTRSLFSNLKQLISFANSIGSKTIAYQISNKKQLKNIIIHNVNILCGDYLLNAFPNPTVISNHERKIIKEKIYE